MTHEKMFEKLKVPFSCGQPPTPETTTLPSFGILPAHIVGGGVVLVLVVLVVLVVVLLVVVLVVVVVGGGVVTSGMMTGIAKPGISGACGAICHNRETSVVRLSARFSISLRR